jgi:hypothetical protein
MNAPALVTDKIRLTSILTRRGGVPYFFKWRLRLKVSNTLGVR